MRNAFFILVFLPTPALAQGAGAAGLFELLLPFILILGIIYFLMIRPQNNRQKEHQAMVDGLRRGDEVIMQGGLIGKVKKVEDDELELEIGQGVRTRVIKNMVISVRAKTEPKA